MNLLLNNSIWQYTAPREMALVGGNYPIESEEHLVEKNYFGGVYVYTYIIQKCFLVTKCCRS